MDAKEMGYTHTIGDLLSHRNEIPQFAAIWMNLKDNMFNEISPTQREMFCDCTYVESIATEWNGIILSILMDE